MHIAIIGTGAVAQRLSHLLTAQGHAVTLGSRDPAHHGNSRAASQTSRVDTIAAAAAAAELVVLAVPYAAVAGLRHALAEGLAGKTLIGLTNPIAEDWSPLDLGDEPSAAVAIQRLFPEAHVVKAFNTVFADRMSPGKLAIGAVPLTVFVAGDHAPAVERVVALAEAIGFRAQRAGGLTSARYLEAMAHLNIAIALAGGGTEAGYAYLQAG